MNSRRKISRDIEIRELAKAGVRQCEIARRFGISNGRVSQIICRELVRTRVNVPIDASLWFSIIDEAQARGMHPNNLAGVMLAEAVAARKGVQA